MRLYLRHRTQYHYAGPVAESHNEVRLMPLTDDDQTCLEFRLTVRPHARVRTYQELGGVVHYFNVHAPHSELEITAESRVETWRTNPFESLNLEDDDWGYYARDAIREDYAEFLAPTRFVPAHSEAARIATTARRKAGASAASFLIVLNDLLGHLLTYEAGATHVHTRLDQFLKDRRGVCQDFAHLMLAVCRSQHIPARYVSGYLYEGPGEPALRGEQATHAWVECLLPDGLWRGFDPTHSLLVNDRYVKAHIGRDYTDVVPARGVYRGPGAHQLRVDIDVQAEGAPGLATVNLT